MPPNYDEIPKPDTLKEKKLKEKDVKSILKFRLKINLWQVTHQRKN